jgi:hypothetical protein
VVFQHGQRQSERLWQVDSANLCFPQMRDRFGERMRIPLHHRQIRRAAFVLLYLLILVIGLPIMSWNSPSDER